MNKGGGKVYEIKCKEEWEAAFSLFNERSLCQSWDWGVARGGEFRTKRLGLASNGRVVALAQVFFKKRLGVPIGWCPGGPLGISELLKADLMEMTKYVGLWLIMAPYAALPNSLISIHTGLFRKSFFHPATIIIDLRKPIEQIKKELHRNWRRNLDKAKEFDLEIKKELIISEHYDLVSCRAREKSYKAHLSIKELNRIQEVFSDRHRIYNIYYDGELISSRSVVCTGNIATDLLTGSTPIARKVNADHAILWHIIRELKDEGFVRFDLGGIDETANPGVAYFKRGTGGEEWRFPGTMLCAPPGRFCASLVSRFLTVTGFLKKRQ